MNIINTLLFLLFFVALFLVIQNLKISCQGGGVDMELIRFLQRDRNQLNLNRYVDSIALEYGLQPFTLGTDRDVYNTSIIAAVTDAPRAATDEPVTVLVTGMGDFPEYV